MPVRAAEDPIDYESHDDEPVDLIFLLLAPDHASGDHLKALASISRVVREPSVLERCARRPTSRTARLALDVGLFPRTPPKANLPIRKGRAARGLPEHEHGAERDAADDDTPPGERREAVPSDVVEQVPHDDTAGDEGGDESDRRCW